MSPVEFWGSCSFWGQAKELSIEKVFDTVSKKCVIVTESQDEHDYCWAMQMIMGREIQVVIKDPDLEVGDYLKKFSWVFTTWDPADRNRI